MSEIHFREMPVPADIRNFGVMRSFKPDNGGDYRVIQDDKGKWYTFPRVKLSDNEKAAIALLMVELKTDGDLPKDGGS